MKRSTVNASVLCGGIKNRFLPTSLSRYRRQTFGHWDVFAHQAVSRSFLSTSPNPVRELATLLALTESLAEDGFEPLTIRSMRKNLTAGISRHPIKSLLQRCWIPSWKQLWGDSFMPEQPGGAPPWCVR